MCLWNSSSSGVSCLPPEARFEPSGEAAGVVDETDAAAARISADFFRLINLSKCAVDAFSFCCSTTAGLWMKSSEEKKKSLFVLFQTDEAIDVMILEDSLWLNWTVTHRTLVFPVQTFLDASEAAVFLFFFV